MKGDFLYQKLKEFHILKLMAEPISTFIPFKETSENRIFSKLISIYHLNISNLFLNVERNPVPEFQISVLRRKGVVVIH